jgi:hypothetical protein
MSSFEILYTSESIRRAVRDVFGKGSGRRVAVVAFVGSRAEAYLPHPKGLELYCWPTVPGTNPSAIRKLAKDLGVDVHFADKIHMKLYWSAKGGAIIASSNLSSNAYGHGDLKELGVRLPARTVDINKVLKSFQSSRITDASLKALKDATAKHRRETQRTRNIRVGKLTFGDWYTKYRRGNLWKLSAWENVNLRESQKLREAVSAAGHTHLEEYMAMRTRDQADVNDYVLCVEFDETGWTGNIEWFFVSHRVRVPEADSGYLEDYPFQIGQEHPLKMYRRPPFEIDKQFRSALKAAYKEMPEERAQGEFDLEDIVQPSPALLKLVLGRYLAGNVSSHS